MMAMSRRYLGVDLGTKRVGLALADDVSGIASPVSVIQARATMRETAAAIAEVAGDYAVTDVVVGLALNMDGTEGPQAKLCKQLADELTNVLQPPAENRQRKAITRIHLHDERLTSHAADQRLARGELTHKKKKARHDAIAAQILLESFIQSQQSE
jgi:putative Holliday junction resolvase